MMFGFYDASTDMAVRQLVGAPLTANAPLP